MYSLLYIVYSLLYIVYNLLYIVYNLLYVAYNLFSFWIYYSSWRPERLLQQSSMCPEDLKAV